MAILDRAIDFIASLLPLLAENATIQAGSHHGSDPFLDQDAATRFLAVKPHRRSTGTINLPVTAANIRKLESLRQTFTLQSLGTAASLATRIYIAACDHIWRGNSLMRQTPDGDCTRINTDSLYETITGRPAP